MHPLHMFHKFLQTIELIITLPALPRVGHLVPLHVCYQDRLVGELLVAVLAGVGGVAASMDGGYVPSQCPLATKWELLVTMRA